MSSENPYRAPLSSFQLPETLANKEGIWRDGKKLVVHKQAKLPPICVKTNEPSQREIKRKYYWHHPTVFLAVLLHVFIYVILAMVFRKKHVLKVPVTYETAGKRRNWIGIGWVLALGSVALFVGSMFLLLQDNNSDTNVGLGIVGLVLAGIGLITGLIFGSRAAGILYPKKMTETATWFTGAHWEYLERFPQVPPNV